MEEEPGRVTRSRRRLSVEQDSKHEDSPMNTPTKKKTGRLSIKPQLDNIVENEATSIQSPRRGGRKSLAPVAEPPATEEIPPGAVGRAKSAVTAAASVLDSPKPGKRITRRTSIAGIESETAAPLTPLRRSRRNSTEQNNVVEETLIETKTNKSAKKLKEIEPLLEENEKENADSNTSLNNSVNKDKVRLSEITLQKLKVADSRESINVSTNSKKLSLTQSAKKEQENTQNGIEPVNSIDSPKCLARRSRSLSAKQEISPKSDDSPSRRSPRISAKNVTPEPKKDECSSKTAKTPHSSSKKSKTILKKTPNKSPSSENKEFTNQISQDGIKEVILRRPGPRVSLNRVPLDNSISSKPEITLEESKNTVYNETEDLLDNAETFQTRKLLNISETVASLNKSQNESPSKKKTNISESKYEESMNKSKIESTIDKNSFIFGMDEVKDKIDSVIYMEVDEDMPEEICTKPNNKSACEKPNDVSLDISKVKWEPSVCSEENIQDPSISKEEELNASVNELNNYREIKYFNKDKSSSKFTTSKSMDRSILFNDSNKDIAADEPNNVSTTDEKKAALKLCKNAELSKSLQEFDSRIKASKKNTSLEELSQSTPTRIKQLKRLDLPTSTPILPCSSKAAENKSSSKSKKNIRKSESEHSDNDSDAISNRLYINDEAEDAGMDYQSGDSLDEDEGERIKDGEIEHKGETLGSDTEEESDESEYEKGSFIVTSDEEDDQLLSGDGDDLSLTAEELTQSAKSKKIYNNKKNKEQKKASREMYDARHSKDNVSHSKLESDSDTEIVIKKSNKKRNRIESEGNEEAEMTCPNDSYNKSLKDPLSASVLGKVEHDSSYVRDVSIFVNVNQSRDPLSNTNDLDGEDQETSTDEESQKIIETYESMLSHLNKSPLGINKSNTNAQDNSAIVETLDIVPKKSRKSSIASSVSVMESTEVIIPNSPLNVTPSTKENIVDTNLEAPVKKYEPNMSVAKETVKNIKKNTSFTSVTLNNSSVENTDLNDEYTYADQSSNSDNSTSHELSLRSFKNALDSVRKKKKTDSNVSNNMFNVSSSNCNNSIEITPLVINSSASVIKDVPKVNESIFSASNLDSGKKKKKKNVSFSLESNDSSKSIVHEVESFVNEDTSAINKSLLVNLEGFCNFAKNKNKNENNSFSILENISTTENDTMVAVLSSPSNSSPSISKKTNNSIVEPSVDIDNNAFEGPNESTISTSSSNSSKKNKKKGIDFSVDQNITIENLNKSTILNSPSNSSISKKSNNSFIETSVNSNKLISNLDSTKKRNSFEAKVLVTENTDEAAVPTSPSFVPLKKRYTNESAKNKNFSEELHDGKKKFKQTSHSIEDDLKEEKGNESLETVDMVSSNKKSKKKNSVVSDCCEKSSDEENTSMSAAGVFNVSVTSTHKSPIQINGESSAKKKNTRSDLPKFNMSGACDNINTENGTQFQSATIEQNSSDSSIASTHKFNFLKKFDCDSPVKSAFEGPICTSTEKKKKLKKKQLDSSIFSETDKGKDESVVLFPEVKMSDVSNQSYHEVATSHSKNKKKKKIKSGDTSLFNVSGLIQTDLPENVAEFPAAKEVDKSASPCYNESLVDESKQKIKKREREHEKKELQSSESQETQLDVFSTDTQEISHKKKKIKYTKLMDNSVVKEAVEENPPMKRGKKRKATDELTKETSKNYLLKQNCSIRRLPATIIEQLKPPSKKSKTDFAVEHTSKRKAKPSTHLDQSILVDRSPTCVGKTGQFVTVQKKKVMPSFPLVSTSNFGATTQFKIERFSKLAKNELRMDHLQFHMGSNFKEETLAKRKRMSMQDLLRKQRSQFAKGRIIRK